MERSDDEEIEKPRSERNGNEGFYFLFFIFWLCFHYFGKLMTERRGLDLVAGESQDR